MIDWELDPENKALYERVVEQNRRLQRKLGLVPMAIEQRHQAYLKRKQQEADLVKSLGQRRLPPKWKI